MYASEISRLSMTQWVPGLDPDDIASEMMICLWRAVQTYKQGSIPFGAYWWRIWANRRDDITEAYYAVKRVHGIPTEVLPEGPAPVPQVFPLPPTRDPLAVRVWNGLASGDAPIEVQTDNAISRRRYYDLVASWRTDEVRRRLQGRDA